MYQILYSTADLIDFYSKKAFSLGKVIEIQIFKFSIEKYYEYDTLLTT